MASLGTELEKKPSAEEVAAQEVEGYLEKIEKQTETKPPQSSPLTTAPAATPPPPAVYDDMGKVVMQSAKAGKTTIVLPLSEDEIRKGLHHKIIDGIRWLAEWSIYIIKKYPGRVFYRSSK